MKSYPLAQPLLFSALFHAVSLLLLSMFVVRSANLPHKDFLPVGLVDLAPAVKQTAIENKAEKLARNKRPPPPRVEKTKDSKPIAKSAAVESPRPIPPPALVQPKVDAEKAPEGKTAPQAPAEQAPAPFSSAKDEGGGSAAGAGNLFGNGDVAVVPGGGTSGGGGGTANAGLGRSSGVPGLPAPTPILRTNRAAKPIRTVKASYPPMALRKGMEGDVLLKIEVDPDGKVTKAEIIKSAGAGFDEEALKAIKQSRFEPAQRDGQNVPAEFTYVYRFRLAR